MKKKPPRPPFSAAFTLLELLVSSAILGIVMLVMLAAVDTGMRLWKGSQDRITVDREARTAFSMIGEDLRNIVLPKTAAPQPVFKNPSGSDGTFMEFLVKRPSAYQNQNEIAGNLGDVCYVRYRFSNNQILRAYADSAETYDSLRNNTYPSNDAIEEVLAINIRSVAVGTQGPGGVANTLPLRSLYYSIEATEPSSFGPGSPPPRNRQYFTATASLPPQ